MLRYKEIIVEEIAELSRLEKEHRHSLPGRRIAMLLLLRSGEARSIQAAARKLNYSLRQCQRWFKEYQTKGIEGMLVASGQGRGCHERMTEAAWEALDKALAENRIGCARDAREVVAEQGVIYQSDSSLLKLFARHNIKAKVARPQHQKRDAEGQREFKKTS